MKTLEFSDITLEGIAQAFEAAAIKCKVDEEENELYLSDGVAFPFWLMIDAKAKRFKFSTHIKTREGTSRERLMEFTHELNDQYVTVRFTAAVANDNGNVFLHGDYFLYTAFGIIVPQLILTAKNFADIFIQAIREEDKDDEFFA